MSDRFELDHLGLGRVTLICGDLAAETADVLVNEANDHLQMTGGVAGALRKRGGVAIHQEAIAMGPLPLGRVVRTSPGHLDARVLYHAITQDYELDRGISGKVVTTVVAESMRMAAEDEAESVCFPLFGAGGGLASVRHRDADRRSSRGLGDVGTRGRGRAGDPHLRA